MDITKMNYMELDALYQQIAKEKSKRKEIKEQELWKNVVKAIEAFTAEFGNIYIVYPDGEKTYLSSKDDYGEPGYIDLAYC